MDSILKFCLLAKFVVRHIQALQVARLIYARKMNEKENLKILQ